MRRIVVALALLPFVVPLASAGDDAGVDGGQNRAYTMAICGKLLTAKVAAQCLPRGYTQFVIASSGARGSIVQAPDEASLRRFVALIQPDSGLWPALYSVHGLVVVTLPNATPAEMAATRAILDTL